MKNNFFIVWIFSCISVCGIAQTIPLNPPSDSLLKIRTEELNRLKPAFQQTKNDSLFALVYSEIDPLTSAAKFVPVSGIPGAQKIYAAPYPGNAQAAFEQAKPGDVIGPFVSGNVIGIYKVKSKGTSSDSAMVRHLLIAYRGADASDPQLKRPKWKAKALADSLCSVIVSGKTPMTDLILPFTDDPGSRMGNLGNYGMFSRKSGFVKEFENAGFNNPVGATVVVETPFGYHIIQVLGKKTAGPVVKAYALERIIDRELDYRQQGQPGATLPEFPGGTGALQRYLSDSLRYPVNAKAHHNEAYVEILFKVGKNGKIYDVAEAPVAEPADQEFIREAKRLIAAMPQWKPAMYKGKEIDWLLKVKVPFRL